MSSLCVALTGATGYIASHVAVALFERGHTVVGFDNFANSNPAVLDRIRDITEATVAFEEIDLLDTDRVATFLAEHGADAVIHFAGLKAVGESSVDPLSYYEVNVGGAISLARAMQRAEITDVVFSSSATVYAEDQPSPLSEKAGLGPSNPYGRTKLHIEQILGDLAAAGQMRAVNLRYFNPIGAHPSGRIGEDPVGVPNNLMPFIMQVAVGRREELQVFGNDYDTPDGTGIRDYIHVMDLADGHVAAVEALAEPGRLDALTTVNLGTGTGTSVLEMLAAAERAADKKIPHRIVERRPGDVAEVVANPALAEELLGWTATRTAAEACADHWRWQHDNPQGY